MSTNTKKLLLLGVPIVGLLLFMKTGRKKYDPVPVGTAFASIWDYVEIMYYLSNSGWVQITDVNHLIIDGTWYGIRVSQDCVLTYNGLTYQLLEGSNTLVWGISGKVSHE